MISSLRSLSCWSLLGAFALGALSLSGCQGVGIQGSGVSKSETRDLEPFHAVTHSAVGNVTVDFGPEQKVEVTFDDNLLELVDTTVVNGELKIKTTGSYSSTSGLQVRITVPSLDHVKLTGVGKIRVSGFDGDSLTIEQSGVGSSTVSGTTKSLSLSISGVGSADLQDLIAESATVKVSGVGGASVHVTKSLNATTSGIGGIKVAGNPEEKNTKSTGIGKVSFE